MNGKPVLGTDETTQANNKQASWKKYKVLIGCTNKSTKRASKQIEVTQSAVKVTNTNFNRAL